MTALTQEQQQEILKGLLKSAIEKNTEEFKSQLEGAKNVGFDFFNTKLSEDYEFNDITVYKDTSLIHDVRIMKQRYPEKLSEIFFEQKIITQNNVEDLYNNIYSQSNLTISYNLNFIKLSLDYVKNESIQIDQMILKKICLAAIHTMNDGFSRCGAHQYSEVQENIFKIEEVVKSLVPLLEESEKKKFENAFYNRKDNVKRKLNTPPKPTQLLNGSVHCEELKGSTSNTEAEMRTVKFDPTVKVQGIPPVGNQRKTPKRASKSVYNDQLPPKIQDNQPPTTENNSPQLEISPRGLIMIAAGAIAGALALYFLAPLILGSTVGIGAQLGLGAAGAAVGGVIGYFTDIVINKCCGQEAAVQTA